MTKNNGTYVTRNTLIAQSNYENLLLFDADDIMVKTMLKNLDYVINEHPQAEVIQFRYQNFKDNVEHGQYGSNTQYAHGALFFNKEAFYEKHGYENWMCGADSELLLKYKDVNILRLDKVLLYRRVHENSLTRIESTGLKSEYRRLLRLFIQFVTLFNKNNRTEIEVSYFIVVDNNLAELIELERLQIQEEIEIRINDFKKILRGYNITC